jgi:protoporphyrinogen oxidase
VAYKGYLFDIGGHRFFTKLDEVQKIWQEVMDDGFLKVNRLSRILYRGKFFHYPLKPLQALLQMGLFESAWVVLSYLRKQVFPLRPEDNLENWMSNRFGRRLFLMFFKHYTEKVWGLPCTEIRAEWGAQRIKTVTLGRVMKNALLPGRNQERSLIEVFDYPARGPGQLWERMADRLVAGGQEVRLGSTAVTFKRTGFRVDSVVAKRAGSLEETAGTDFIVSMPLPELVLGLDPPAPDAIQDAARALRYRDFITVAVMIRRPDVFPDNWIYIHTPEVKVGRIQNFRNWSASMVPEPGATCLGMEYFCNEGDWLWRLTDEQMAGLARREVVSLGFAKQEEVFDAKVVRQKKAYPVYDPAYRGHLEVLKAWLLQFENLQMVGRNGLHKYNNQDHAMLTALLAAKNVLGGRHDVWAVNTEEEYHEVQSEARPTAE